jgi:hypothetical protein
MKGFIMKLVKKGRFAFDGVHVRSVMNDADIDGLKSQWKDQLVDFGWLIDTDKSKPEVKEENHGQKDLSIDWGFVDELVAAGDKLGLDEYAATFGIKLKRTKSIENMLNDFKEEAKS